MDVEVWLTLSHRHHFSKTVPKSGHVLLPGESTQNIVFTVMFDFNKSVKVNYKGQIFGVNCIINLNFQPVGVVSRYRDPQLQPAGNDHWPQLFHLLFLTLCGSH